MHSRLRAYKETKKILNISLGADRGSELEERFLAGSQLEWHHHCPACGKPFRYVFDSRSPECNIRFDLTKVVAKKTAFSSVLGLTLTAWSPSTRSISPQSPRRTP